MKALLWVFSLMPLDNKGISCGYIHVFNSTIFQMNVNEVLN